MLKQVTNLTKLIIFIFLFSTIATNIYCEVDNNANQKSSKPEKVKMINVLKACSSGLAASVLGYFAFKHLIKTFKPFSEKGTQKTFILVKALHLVGYSIPTIGLGYLTYTNALAAFKYASKAIDFDNKIEIKNFNDKSK